MQKKYKIPLFVGLFFLITSFFGQVVCGYAGGYLAYITAEFLPYSPSEIASELILILSLSGCGIFPIETAIKENHFRFENFRRDVSDDLEFVYLMCSHHKPISWEHPKQYESGEHNLWVMVETYRRVIPTSYRVAVVNFDVNLQADKSYMLNRKIVDRKASLWIQEVETGLIVSEVLSTDLERPLSYNFLEKRKQCKTGSV